MSRNRDGRSLGRRAGFYSLRNMGSELVEAYCMARSIAGHEPRVTGWGPARGRVISTGCYPTCPLSGGQELPAASLLQWQLVKETGF